MYCVVNFFAKLSILLLYFRVFIPNKRNWTYWYIHVVLWTDAAFYFANMVVASAMCIPRERIWNHDVPGHCVNIDAIILFNSFFNAVSDASMVVPPLANVWKLQMKTSRKVGLSAIFATGILYAP